MSALSAARSDSSASLTFSLAAVMLGSLCPPNIPPLRPLLEALVVVVLVGDVPEREERFENMDDLRSTGSSTTGSFLRPKRGIVDGMVVWEDVGDKVKVD